MSRSVPAAAESSFLDNGTGAFDVGSTLSTQPVEDDSGVGCSQIGEIAAANQNSSQLSNSPEISFGVIEDSGLGDQEADSSQRISTSVLHSANQNSIPEKNATPVGTSYASLLPDEGVDLFEAEKQWLQTLINRRNSLFPEFIQKDASTSSVSMFETSEVWAPDRKTATDLELERLQAQEATLKEEVDALDNLIREQKSTTAAELEKCRKQQKKLEKKTEDARQKRREIRTEIKQVKEETKERIRQTKRLSDRTDFIQKAMENLFAVSKDGLCQDEQFCAQFGAGCCRNMQKQ